MVVEIFIIRPSSHLFLKKMESVTAPTSKWIYRFNNSTSLNQRYEKIRNYIVITIKRFNHTLHDIKHFNTKKHNTTIVCIFSQAFSFKVNGLVTQ